MDPHGFFRSLSFLPIALANVVAPNRTEIERDKELSDGRPIPLGFKKRKKKKKKKKNRVLKLNRRPKNGL